MQNNSMTHLEFIGVVPAAGIGSRMQVETPKQYLTIAGKSILEHSVYALLQHPAITRVVVALHPNDQIFASLPIARDPRVHPVTGGATRAESVQCALEAISQLGNYNKRTLVAVVHDAARPCLANEDVARLLDAFRMNPTQGALLAAPVRDTMKRSDPDLCVAMTVAREQLWHAQTPQVALVDVLVDALTRCGAQATDEASALELTGLRPQIVPGPASNLKVTHGEDLLIATHFMEAQLASTLAKESGVLAAQPQDAKPDKYEQECTMVLHNESNNEHQLGFRIGQGFDVHKFGGPGPVILGGIEIEHSQGLVAHSDGDVLLHALADALLGALAMGDIGHLFPDTDPQFKGADSKVLLAEVYRRVTEHGYQLVNADVTVMAEMPKLKPHNLAIRQCIAEVLQVPMAMISVKATTTEQLGFVGRHEGIACQAVVLLQGSPTTRVKDTNAV